MRRAITVLIVSLAVGCGPGKMADETGRGAPRNLEVKPDHQMLELSWTKHTDALITGYNIYISRQPLREDYPGSTLPSGVAPFNPSPFPGDTNPDDGVEHFTAEELENGVSYYVTIRMVYPDGTLSPPSREIEVVCNPRGEVVLSIRYESDRDGYSFAGDHYVRADNEENDLYFFSKDGIDYLASPDRLDGFLKSNNYSVLTTKGSLDEASAEANRQGQRLWSDRVMIDTGDWLLMRSPSGERVLINVLGLEGSGSDRQVRLFFAYSTVDADRLSF
ncbi:MAG: fibronectin type III domain-containing protein [Candidatus Zixiibacteriota bacterium]|nr:MAG: fibronectin type III domain-containing protein [candidate division Zixibacteria bacterium]